MNSTFDDSKPCCLQVRVEAPARLHMGFLDPSGQLGRSFGSIGLALQDIQTTVRVSPSPVFKVTGPSRASAEKIVNHLLGAIGAPRQVHVHIESAIPSHAGLGSGTQLALAAGMALCKFWGLAKEAREIAVMTGRGARSGVGIAVFEQGGFVVDGGRGPKTLTPPLLSRLPVPPSWNWLMIFDDRYRGLSGIREAKAFRTLPPFAPERAARLCHLLLIQGLPALAEGDARHFAEVLAEVQKINGDYFAPIQGGRYSSENVSEALAWLKQQGLVGMGQSSWGPTGFCLIPDVTQAGKILGELGREFRHKPGLRFEIVKARNRGAEIESIAESAEPSLCLKHNRN